MPIQQRYDPFHVFLKLTVSHIILFYFYPQQNLLETAFRIIILDVKYEGIESECNKGIDEVRMLVIVKEYFSYYPSKLLRGLIGHEFDLLEGSFEDGLFGFNDFENFSIDLSELLIVV